MRPGENVEYHRWRWSTTSTGCIGCLRMVCGAEAGPEGYSGPSALLEMARIE